MRSNRFLIVMLLVLVHSFISCDGAVYHLQEDVNNVNSAQHLALSADEPQNDDQAPGEIHAHQHCHCGYCNSLKHAIILEQSTPSLSTFCLGLNIPPDLPPPHLYS